MKLIQVYLNLRLAPKHIRHELRRSIETSTIANHMKKNIRYYTENNSLIGISGILNVKEYNDLVRLDKAMCFSGFGKKFIMKGAIIQ